MAMGRATAADNLFFLSNGTAVQMTLSGSQTVFAGGLSSPCNLTFDTNGDLFVANDPGGIYKIGPTGVPTLFATETDPEGVAVDASGNVYVADDFMQCIYKYTRTGVRSVFTTNVGSNCRNVAYDPLNGNLFEADATVAPYGAIYEFTPSGTRTTFASGLYVPENMAFDSSGNLYVLSGGSVDKFTPSGAESLFASGLNYPRGIAVDASGNVFVDDSNGPATIYEYAPNGTRSTLASGVYWAGLAVAPAIASPSAWAAAVSGSWSKAGNWIGPVPNAAGAVAFVNAPTTSAATLTLDAPLTLGTLLLGNSAVAGAGYTLAGVGSNTLTLSNSGEGAMIAVTNGTHALSTPLTLDENLTVSSNGALTLGGPIANGSNGPMGISLTGSGSLALASSNTYSGNTTINGGTLVLAHGLAAQNSTVNLNGGSLNFAAGVTSPVLGGLTGSGSIALATRAVEPVTLNVGANAQNTTYYGVLSGAGGLSKQGVGTLTLAAPTTYQGPTIIAAGTLNFLASGGPTGATISAGGTANPGSYSLTGNTLSISGAGADIWGGTQQGYYVYVPVSASQSFDVAVHIAGMTTQNSDGWEKAGILVRQDASNNADPAVFIAETSGNGVNFEWVDQSRTLQFGTSLGPNWLRLTYNPALDLFNGYESPSTSSTPPSASDSSWIFIGNYSASMGTAGGFLLGIAATAHNNADTVTAVFDNLGTMKSLFAPVTPVNYLPATTALSIAGSGILDLSGGNQQVASLSGQSPGNGGSIVNSGSAASVLTLSPSGGSTTFSGMIRGGGTLGRISLIKNGSGTQVLAGSNTYTGPTTVNQGTLLVNGSLVSPVTVNSGGMLGGSGSLSSVTVTSGGFLSPGAAPSALNVSGSLSLLSGAKMDYALDTPADSDEVYMPSGPLVLSGQQFADFNFTWSANVAPGTYMLIDAQSISGSLGTSTGGTIDGLQANIAIQGDDVVLNVVPEPSTLVLLGVGGLGLLGYESWRRRHAKLA